MSGTSQQHAPDDLLLLESRLAALQAENACLRAAAGAIGTAIIRCDANALVQELNSEAEALTGWTAGAAQGRPISDVIRLRNPQDSLADLAPSPSAHELRLLDAGGEQRVVLLSVSPLSGTSGTPPGLMLLFRDRTATLQTSHALQERVKELNCLHGLGRIVEKRGYCIEGILRDAVLLLPRSWQYPEDAAARITWHGNVYTAGRFAETQRRQHADLICAARRAGAVEVGYVSEQKLADEGPFLKEERTLLNSFAERLGRVIERIEAEQARRTVAERFSAVFELSPDLVCTVDDSGLFKELNPAWAQVLGYSPEEMRDRPFLELVHPEDRAATEEVIGEKLRRGQPVLRFENRYIGKDGRIVWLEWTARPAPNNGYTIAIARDVTERRKTMEAQDRELRQVLGLLDGIEDVTYVADPDTYELLHVNATARRIWGEDIVGKKCYRVLQQRKRPCPFCTNELIFGEHLGKAYVWEHRNAANKHWYRCADKAIRWSDGRLVRFEMAVDITEQKNAEAKAGRAEAALRRMNERLKASNQELEQFAYVASHDLQEPLRMISSYTQLLERRYADRLDQDAKEFIGFAVDGANRMQRLIQDLLAYSRVNTRGRSPEPVDADAALGEALLNLRASIEESSALVTNDDLPEVLADRGQLVQLFQNLVGNGIKFSRRQQTPRVHIHVQTDENPGFRRFSVSDNGIGIASEHAERIFVIFQRLHTRREYSGTGIGLALCKRIVERHGGKIWHDPEAQEGATFHFTIPAVTRDAGVAQDGQSIG